MPIEDGNHYLRIYVFIELPQHVLNVTHGQFLRGVKLTWIKFSLCPNLLYNLPIVGVWEEMYSNLAQGHKIEGKLK